MNDIFISYSRYDAALVDAFVVDLENEGFSVWIDRDGIESGDAFKRVILRAIKESQIVLFFSSEHSNQSEWTAKEIGVAVKYKKHIIPVKLDSSNFNEDVEFDLINLDFVDYSVASTQAKMKERLLKTLRNKLGKKDERSEAKHKANEIVVKEKNEEEERRRMELLERREQEYMERARKVAEMQKWLACPEGALQGVFSVSSKMKVFFSKGNLQYHVSTKTWSFAARQFDFVGEGNGTFEKSEEKVNLFRKRELIIDNRDVIDLFGWGTGDAPTKHTAAFSDYAKFFDWGRNKLSNGDNREGLWRTLTKDEWKYVIEERETTSGMRFAKAQVNSVNGVILLPDDWDDNNFALNNVNQSDGNYNGNVIAPATWEKELQAFGAVFLPAAGYRQGTSVEGVGTWGYYWSSSYYNNAAAWQVCLYNGNLDAESNDSRGYGLSVRLVTPAVPLGFR